VDLEPKAMAVLLVLAERSGQVVRSDELIRRVWHGRPMSDNPVYKAVAKLRRALRDDAVEPRYIETISRKGYRLLIEPQPLPAARVEHMDMGAAAPRLPKIKRTPTRRASLALSAWLGVASLSAFYLMWPHAVPAHVHPALSRLPVETELLYESARLELQARRPGFAHRLRRDAEALIEDAPELADGHALRAVACSAELSESLSTPLAALQSRANALSGPLHCARESSRRAMELDSRSPLAIMAVRFAERERADACASSAGACFADSVRVVSDRGPHRRAARPGNEASMRVARMR
jgi:hypothetical protein